MPSRSDLTRYPRPSLAVDVAVLTVLPSVDHQVPTQSAGRLAVLVEQRTTAPLGPVLVGRFVREREPLSDAVRAALLEKAGIETSREPTLLRIFDAPDRDERGWVVSAAHALALPYDEAQDASGSWIPVDPRGRLASGEHLLFDHDEMLLQAVSAIRERYELGPDPDRLLGDRFTLLELRELHEAVLGAPLLRDTFNRRMVEHLTEVSLRGESLTKSSGGRPAKVYRHKARTSLSSSEVRRLRLPRAER